MVRGNSILIAAALLNFCAFTHLSWAQEAVSQAEHDRMEAEANRKIAYYQDQIESDKKTIESDEQNLDYASRYQNSLVNEWKRHLLNDKDQLRIHEASLAEWQAKLRNLPPVQDEQSLERIRESYRQQEQDQNERAEKSRRQLQSILDAQTLQRQNKADANTAMFGIFGKALQDTANAIAERNIRQAEQEAEPEPVPEPIYSAPERRVIGTMNDVPVARERTSVIGRVEGNNFIPNTPPPPPQPEKAKPLFDNLSDFMHTVIEKTSKVPDQKDFLGEYQSVASDMGAVLPPDKQFEVRSAQILSAWATFDLKGVANAYSESIDNSLGRGMDEILRDIPDSRPAPRRIDQRLTHALDEITEPKNQPSTNAPPGLLESLDDLNHSSSK